MGEVLSARPGKYLFDHLQLLHPSVYTVPVGSEESTVWDMGKSWHMLFPSHALNPPFCIEKTAGLSRGQVPVLFEPFLLVGKSPSKSSQVARS